MQRREEYENIERETLAPYAMLSASSEGREHTEKQDPYRTCFQRDRDRIIHSSAFRRLEYKTQVFVYHEGDHYRTRLTHTLEGSQIARSLARMLRLNEDLSEAIILAHDLGHTPFGHSGQTVMNQLMKGHGGFEHNKQSLRVITLLEQRYAAFPGLNVTFEVREGIAKHKTEYDNPQIQALHKYPSPSLEAQLVNVADEIAYCNHDLDDGIQSGLLTLEKLRDVDLWQEHYERVQQSNAPVEIQLKLTVRNIINAYIQDLAKTSEDRMTSLGMKSIGDVRQSTKPCIAYSDELAIKNRQLKKFLLENMYFHPRVIKMAEEAEEILQSLFARYLETPRELPEEVQKRMHVEASERVVCDYIAGMTDRFAIEEHRRLR